MRHILHPTGLATKGSWRMAGKLRDRFRKIIGRPGTADLGRYESIVRAAGDREDHVHGLSDSELTEAAGKLRGEGAEPTDEELAELGALAREAARRTIGERPYDVQLLGMIGLLTGHVVEMATGEGKTLAGALAAAGYALRGRRVHVMTINDYLAHRDAEWMRPVYDLLGVTVGAVGQTSTPEERRAAYEKQVAYGPVSEIGFDLLRDRLAADTADLLLPEPDVALIDEVDSVVVDEALVPLVMAGAVEGGPADPRIAEIVRGLKPRIHYDTDDERRAAHLTETGIERVEKELGGVDLYGAGHNATLAAVNVALHAHALLKRDVDYVVKDGRVQLISAARGRVAQLQRWPDGLQAAVEAKEGVAASESGEVLDSVTVQALIRRYPTVCGMTGTAVAVAEQLREFYALEVAVIPPNVPCVRDDEPDRLYSSVADKEQALVAQIAAAHETGRPVLIGTLDVAESERLARRLKVAGVACQVLNAKNDAEEAAIIAEAGARGAVTVSTQMAGRGTDIRLGGSDGAGHDEVAELGGLYVIGSGRYMTSRLDNQLRGRSGRQGDPGGSVFFTSMADDLVTLHAPESAHAEGDPSDGLVADASAQRTVEHAQRVAEGVHLEIHRTTWKYNKLVEHQRGILLDHRGQVLRTDAAARELATRAAERYEKLADTAGEEPAAAAARQITLHHLDRLWVEHLAYLSDLREGIHLRALGRENPLDEFHKAAIPAFHKIVEESWTRAVETLDTAEVGPGGIDLPGAGVQRPTSTWTYLVNDNPFESPEARALRRIGSMLGRGKTR
jgi:preprotein translocase subunit SecA